ncbi:hypothetical protein SAMN06265346_109112 [Flavobacterium hercynium]|nr:hypothetical protein SAMN06265346_109112 [Flavobacterium hercynium]
MLLLDIPKYELAFIVVAIVYGFFITTRKE